MTDAAYDSDALRQVIADEGAIAVIPNNPSRTFKHRFDKHPYAQRHLVECCFSKLAQFRRVATRLEKTAHNIHERLEGYAMGQVLHGSARTTGVVRRAIQHSRACPEPVEGGA